MSDRDILRQASDNSDDWSDETWAAWGRLADQAHGRESVPALLAEVERLSAELSSATDVIAEQEDEIGAMSAKNAALRAELADRPTQTKETSR
uniref:Uncharacterized protein n=1 Tax=Streptomyces sp. W75 TaxID=1170711 RepID=I0CEB4_9ACTN|nr:hypothetical protein [Streptomyces sp. W75]AFH75127.1 hypothetical protein pCQ4.2 [Streptomyces sp. W75]